MESIAKFDYNDLAKVHDLRGMKRIIISLSPAQVAALKKVEKRSCDYQLSSSLEPGSIRTAIKGFMLFIPELWGSYRHPNLVQIRAEFIGGYVTAVRYEETNYGNTLVHLTLDDSTK